MKPILLALLLMAVMTGAAIAAQPGALSDPKLEARAVTLQKELRCLVCQGESLDESNAPLAADLRHLIRVRIAVGDTNEEVERYLVARYGDFILMKPPLEPQTYLLWFGPFAVLLLGGTIVGTVVFRARKKLKAEKA
jgi:cytochrome c-type biogenesis protein CcmH